VFKCLQHTKLDEIKNPCFFTFMSQFAKMGTFKDFLCYPFAVGDKFQSY
jgi:hypothetical protein